jgi:hypothetical protein
VEVVICRSGRVLEHRFHRLPLAIVVALEETAVSPGVAGDAGFVAQLGDAEQQHVVVAVHADVVHLLHVAGLLALVPQALAAAAPVDRLAALGRGGQGLAVHPGEHQHVAAAPFLRDDGHQAVAVPLDLSSQSMRQSSGSRPGSRARRQTSPAPAPCPAAPAHLHGQVCQAIAWPSRISNSPCQRKDLAEVQAHRACG